MGNQLVQTVNDQLPQCCNQVLTDEQKCDLRVQTSNSRLFAEEAKHKNTLTLTSPKSLTSLSSPSISCDIVYSLESSDSCNDEILSNDLINKKLDKKKIFIAIPESSTTSADHTLETVEITKTDNNNNNNNNKKSKYKNRNYKNKRMSMKTDAGLLLKELSDVEIKLKQEQHEKEVLKRENEALKQKIFEYNNKYGNLNNLSSNKLRINTSLTSDTNSDLSSPKSTGYELLSPTSVLSSPSVSLNINNAYSICSPTSTNSTSDNEPITTPIILTSNKSYRSMKYKKKSLSIPNFDDIGLPKEIICQSIDSCEAINGIVIALKWYSKNGNNHENIYKKMKNANYGKLIINYYNHIMEYHLSENNKNVKSIQKEYKLICNKINKHVSKCTFKQCNGYRRYLRSKNCTNVHKAQTLKQHQLQMYVNTIDGIHTCFMHLTKSFQFK